jgi:hypothetical protein
MPFHQPQVIKNTEPPPPSQQLVLLAKNFKFMQWKSSVCFLRNNTLGDGFYESSIDPWGQKMLKQGSKASLCTKNFTQLLSVLHNLRIQQTH